MDPVRLVVLWHQHQPYYKDIIEDRCQLPWVRLHALKDYYGMARLAEKVPEFHHTVNLVPSLLEQLDDYVSGDATDPWLEHFRRPADSLDSAAVEFILDHFFMAQWERMIRRYPRYAELLQKRRFGRRSAARALENFSAADLRDLQAWSLLTWFHETAREDFSEIGELFRKARDFTEDDKKTLLEAQGKVLAAVVPLHRKLMEAGTLELTTTPFYHPILPLLCDMETALEGLPNCRLPSGWTNLPEDAEAQVAGAVAYFEKTFGVRPAGMWPSEGSVSEQVLEILAKHSITWTATDEEILDKSLGTGLGRRDAELLRPQDLYAPYRFETPSGPVSMLFRDHHLSDLIGFKYSGWEPKAAAADLLARVRKAGKAAAERGNEQPVVSIILDGENCWEHYADNGIDFLMEFYRSAAAARDVNPVHGSKAVSSNDRSLPRLFPGSWISHNFYIWIGHEEDRRAWEYVFRVREDLVRFTSEEGIPPVPGSPDTPAARAWEELYIAEGSDWFWWYGDDRTSGMDEEYDRLFRLHLRNVYSISGRRPPLFLDVPVLHAEQLGRFDPPRGTLKIHLDGYASNYFEWMGAGRYETARDGGVMAASFKAPVSAIRWGFDLENLYLRLDFDAAAITNGSAPLRFVINFVTPKPGRMLRLDGSPGGGIRVLDAEGGELPGAKAVWNEILEARFPFAALHQFPGNAVEFAVEVFAGDGEESLCVLPKRYLLSYTVPGEDYESYDWW